MFETLYNNLVSLQDLKPNKNTNFLFTQLYNWVISWEISCPFCDEKKHTIQNICARAEYEMEKYFAEKILSWEETLEDFPYLKNYEKLIDLEYQNIKEMGKDFTTLLFLWWWPFPVSAIFFAKKYNIKITPVDYSLEAISLWKKIIEKLWYSHLITYEYWDAQNFFSTEKYDVVSIASLVFTSSNLETILKNTHKLDFNILHLRSSEWQRELLYKKLPLDILQKYFQLLFLYHPKDEIINSILLFQKYEK